MFSKELCRSWTEKAEVECRIGQRKTCHDRADVAVGRWGEWERHCEGLQTRPCNRLKSPNHGNYKRYLREYMGSMLYSCCFARRSSWFFVPKTSASGSILSKRPRQENSRLHSKGTQGYLWQLVAIRTGDAWRMAIIGMFYQDGLTGTAGSSW